MKTAAATYVEISREEFESWLDSLHHKWERVANKAGVYVVQLSESVGVHVSSSIGSANVGMGRGDAAVHMKLISTVTGKTLNKKALGQSRFNRTTNWRVNWKKGIESFNSAYMKAKDFYDKIAVVDKDSYVEKWTEEVESIPNWESDTMLKSFHDQLAKGNILSDKQEKVIEMKKKRDSVQPSQPSSSSAPVDEDFLQKLREAYKRARARSDDWTMQFLTSIANQVKSGRGLSSKQQQIVEDKLRIYRVAHMESVSEVTRLYLERNGAR